MRVREFIPEANSCNRVERIFKVEEMVNGLFGLVVALSSRAPGREVHGTNVVQMHFYGWSDHGANSERRALFSSAKACRTRPKTILSLLHNVRSIQRIASQCARETGHPSSPLVVHCSAGIGRSGQHASHLHRLFIAAGVFCAVYSTLVPLPSIGKPFLIVMAYAGGDSNEQMC